MSVEIPTRQRREFLGQQRLLYDASDTEFLLDAFPLADLLLLLAHELCHSHGRGSLGCQIGQQFAIVAGIVLLTEPWSQVDQAHKFPLADQRQHQHDPFRPQSLQGRRAQVQIAHIHGAAGAWQVGE